MNNDMFNNEYPIFSLILATKDRVIETHRFMESLLDQSGVSFEIIIVDQNNDNRLLPLIEMFRSKLHIIHLRSTPGISHARNEGLKIAKGKIIAFPDDDCWYPKNILDYVKNFLDMNPEIHGLTGIPVESNLKPNYGNWAHHRKFIKSLNAWTCGCSITIFLKREIVDRVGFFDENIGVGASTRWQSGEETDYLIRAIKEDFCILYDPKFVVFHPNKAVGYTSGYRLRTRMYSMGFGRVLKKNKRPLLEVAYWLARPVFGIFIALCKLNIPKALMHLEVTRGRFEGYISTQHK